MNFGSYLSEARSIQKSLKVKTNKQDEKTLKVYIKKAVSQVNEFADEVDITFGKKEKIVGGERLNFIADPDIGSKYEGSVDIISPKEIMINIYK